MRKKLFTLFFALVASVGMMQAGVVSGTCGDNLTWSLNSKDSTLTIEGSGAMTSNPWIEYRQYIAHATLPEGLTVIAHNAFWECNSLSTIKIPNSVTRIESNAFQKCGFTSADVPNEVTSIGSSAFWGCPLTSVTIGPKVTSIGQLAFFSAAHIANFFVYAVNPPSGAADCGINANNCTLYVPYGSMETYANSIWWEDFASILPIPGTEPCLIASGTCGAQGDNLTWELSCDGVLTISGTGNMSGYETFGSNAPWRDYRETIVQIVIENGVTSIGDWSFSGCTGLTLIEIPNSVTSIGSYAFEYCSGLTSITIGDGVTSIGNWAFSDCSGLTSLTIPNSVEYIGMCAFRNCSNLVYVSFGNGVKSIGALAFAATGLISIEIPNSVVSIGDRAFEECGFEYIFIPNSVTDIGWGICGDDNLLTDPVYNAHVFIFMPRFYSGAYTIPDGIESIAGEAFSGCTGLTSIEIPNSVTSIDYRAFSGCTGLTSITCEATTPPTCGEQAFYYGVSKSIPLYVPCASIDAYKNAEGWKDFTNIQAINPDDCGPTCPFSGTCGAQGDNLTWELSCEGVLTISGTGEMGEITWGDYKEQIKEVVIENGVTSIANSAFSQCNNLKSIIIGNSVSDIGGYNPFAYSKNISSIVVASDNITFDSRNNCNAIIEKSTNILRVGCNNTILPNDVISIGIGAFCGCEGLMNVEIPNSVISISDWAFYRCKGLTSVEIPNNVITIGEYAFADCYLNLTSVTIGDGVTSIGNSAFERCLDMSSVSIGSNVTNIGSYAFISCTSLSTITCKAVTPPTCGIYAFDGVDKSIPLYVPCASIDAYKNAEGWKDFTNIQAIPGTEPCTLASGTCGAQGDNLTWELSCDSVLTITGTGNMTDFSWNGAPWYSYKSLITEVTIGNSVTSIGDWAFSYCTGLYNIEIPNSVTSIGDYAFHGCTGLTSVTIPNSVTSIGNYAFRGCSGLTSIEIPNSVTSIGGWAFAGCTGLTSVTIPNSVTSIGMCAFSGCSGLTSITIPNSVTSIGMCAFDGCTGLTSITIPNSVISIGDGAFRSCTGLTSITIPNSVTSIGDGAFSGCTGLTSMVVTPGNTTYDSRNNCNAVIETTTNTLIAGCKNTTIPNSVTSIGYGAFGDCSGLTSIEIPNSVTSIGDGAFCSCTGLTSVTIPDNVEYLGVAAFSFCSNLRSVTLGLRIVSIEDTTFVYCSNLQKLIIGPNVYTIRSSAFIGCEGLDTIVNYATTPQELRWYAFESVDKQHCTLYVPCRSINLYKAAEGWSEFTNILPIDTMSFNIDLRVNDETMGNAVVVAQQWLACDTLQFTIQANAFEGYRFVEWIPGGTNMTETHITSQDTIFTAVFAKNVYTIEKIADAEQGSIVGPSEAEYMAEVSLEAIPNEGYHFSQWSDGLAENPRTFVLTQDTTFTAEFAKNVYTIEKIANAEQGSIVGPSEAEYMAEVSLEAIPNEGYHFTQWADGTADNPRVIIVTQDTAFTALFEPNVRYFTVTLETNNDQMGHVEGAGQYEENAQALIYAEPNDMYRFVGWFAGDEWLSDQPAYTITVTSDTTLTAHFESIPMSSNLAMIYINGTPIEGFEPDQFNYTFRNPVGTQESDLPTAADITWDLGDIYQTVEISQVATTIVLNVTSGRGLTKTYVLAFVIEYPNMYTVTTLSNNEAWGAVIGGNTYIANAKVSVGAFAEEGYQFYHWNNSITANPYTFVLTQDTTFAALFLPNTAEDIITDVTSNSVHMEWETKPWGNHGYWIWIYIDKDHKHWYCKMRFTWLGVLDKFYWGPASHNYDPSEPNNVAPRQFCQMPARHLSAAQVISYDLTDLDDNQKYYFTLEDVDEFEEVLSAQAGFFVTPKKTPTDIEDAQSEDVQCTKVLRDNHIYILRGDKTYTIHGQKVK